MIRKATSGSLWSSSLPVDLNRLPSSGQIPDLIGHLAVLRSLKGLCALGRLAASRSKSKSKLHLCHSQAATEKGLATLTSPPPPSPPPKRPPPVDTSPLPGFVLFYECFVVEFTLNLTASSTSMYKITSTMTVLTTHRLEAKGLLCWIPCLTLGWGKKGPPAPFSSTYQLWRSSEFGLPWLFVCGVEDRAGWGALRTADLWP